MGREEREGLVWRGELSMERGERVAGKTELMCEGFRLWTHHDIVAAARDDEHAAENVDVFVQGPDGACYGGTMMTPRCARAIMARHAQTGESACGEYFFCVGLVMIRRMTRECIDAAFRDLVRSGDYSRALYQRVADGEADHTG